MAFQLVCPIKRLAVEGARLAVVPGRIGDLIVVEGRRVGQGRRIGEILEVLGEPGHRHYRVRWEAGRETVFYPSSDATIQHSERRKKRKS